MRIRSASASALASASVISNQRISVRARLGNHGKRHRGSHSCSGRTTTGQPSEEQNLYDVEDSIQLPPPPRDPQVNVVEEAQSRAIVHEGVGEGRSRPPLAPNGGERPC